MNMKIREVRSWDIDQVTVLFDNYRVFYRKESDVESARQFLSERIENGDSRIYVCENDENKLTGFVQLYPLFSSTRMRKLWLLNDLYVDVSSRGQGISLKLIERAKELVKETKAQGMFLETEITNDIGNSLYPRTGFKLNESSNFYEWSVE